MKHRAFMDAKERKLRSELTKLVHDQTWIKANLVTMKRKCGKPGCHCNEGEKHESLYLSIRTDEKRKMIYVPPDWEKTIRKWAENYREIEKKLEFISQNFLDRFLKEKEQSQEEKKQNVGKSQKKKEKE